MVTILLDRTRQETLVSLPVQVKIRNTVVPPGLGSKQENKNEKEGLLDPKLTSVGWPPNIGVPVQSMIGISIGSRFSGGLYYTDRTNT